MLLRIAPMLSTIFSPLPFCILPIFFTFSFWSSVTFIFPLTSWEECSPSGWRRGGSESNNMAKIFQFLLLYGCDQLPLCPCLLQDWLICFVVHLERHQFINIGGFHNYLNMNFFFFYFCMYTSLSNCHMLHSQRLSENLSNWQRIKNSFKVFCRLSTF